MLVKIIDGAVLQFFAIVFRLAVALLTIRKRLVQLAAGRV